MFSRISAGTRPRNKEGAAMVNDSLLSSGPFYMLLVPLTPNPCFRKDTGMVKQTLYLIFRVQEHVDTANKRILYLGLQEYPCTPRKQIQLWP